MMSPACGGSAIACPRLGPTTYDQALLGPAITPAVLRHKGSCYGAWAADALLPNVLTYTPGTIALWDPWRDLPNGKGASEDIASNIIKMMVNQDFSSGLRPGPLLDYFPYLSPPPPAS